MSLLVALLLAQVSLAEEGGAKKAVNHINCVGAGITCSASSTFGTITVPGGGGAAPAACAAGQAVTSNGAALVCTSTLTASDVACAGTCVADAEIAAVSGAKVSGAVATATALDANPTDCAAGQFATAIAASGNLTCATPTNYVHFVTFNFSYTSLTSGTGLQNVEIYTTIPAKARVTRLVGDVTTGFDDGAGPVTNVTTACGKTSGSTGYITSNSIFTARILGDINNEQGANVSEIPSWTGQTSVWCQFISNGGNLNTLTSGAITFYLEYIQYP